VFEKPSIFLIDVEDEVKQELSKYWSSVSSGTLGKPYKIEASSSWSPVIQHRKLAGYEESDLIIIDLALPEKDQYPIGNRHYPEAEPDLWAKRDKGWIDARVRNTVNAKRNINQMVYNGGALVIFSAPATSMEFSFGRVQLSRLNLEEEVTNGLWNLAEPIERLNFSPQSGKVINVINDGAIGALMKRYAEGSEFTCTFESRWRDETVWDMIAENKYGEYVSAIAQHGKGIILIAPQIEDKPGFISELLQDALPSIIPNLFPYIEKGKWINNSSYEFERIKELEQKKNEITARAELEITRIQSEIDQYRDANGWIHDLITATGDKLSEAVRLSLSELGFAQVIDVDQIRDAEGRSRREDLRIEDQSPMLVVDIKGVSGKAGDEDVMQADKHARINIRELGRADIQGISIINQQRNIPPLERENIEPFRPELLSYAAETGLGLMTGFDLYRLILNKRKHEWRPEWIKPIFYMHQRMPIIPTHYRFIGVVSKVFSGNFGIEILENEVCVGDRIAVEGEIFFEEILVESIQVETQQVARVTVGDKAGFVWPESAMKLRLKMPVYAIPQSVFV